MSLNQVAYNFDNYFSFLKVELNDGLPDHICHNCMLKLQLFQTFRETCFASDRTFRGQPAIKIEPSDNVEPSAVDEPMSLKDLTCLNCAAQFNQMSDLEQHLKSVHGDPFESNTNAPRFVCDICSRVFMKKHRIDAHLRQHCGLKPFACSVCDASFKKWSSFRVHQRKHQTGKQFAMFYCEYDGCDKSYDLRQSLKAHQDRVHLDIDPAQGTTFKCDTCGKFYKTLQFLRAHILTHTSTDNWPFSCDVCPKRFISKYACNVHMMRHKNIKNFACSMCDHRTCTKKELEKHFRSRHTEVKHKCDKCKSAFDSKGNFLE